MMLIRPDERQQFARLLNLLLFGERLSERCARVQATIATGPAMRGFFTGQARQEQLHAMIFHHSVSWLLPKGLGSLPVSAPLKQYEVLLEDALQRRDLAETVLAQQVLLEGLGEVILEDLNAGMSMRGVGFTRLRRLFLHQEQAHHAFGVRQLEAGLVTDTTAQHQLQTRALEYLALIEHIFEEVQDLFAFFDKDLDDYLRAVQHGLPTWIKSAL